MTRKVEEEVHRVGKGQRLVVVVVLDGQESIEVPDGGNAAFRG